MKSQTFPGKFLVISCGFVLVAWGIYGAAAMCIFKDSLTKAGQFGDTFGCLNTLFTGLAFAVVLATLIDQWNRIEDIRQGAQEERRFRLRLDLYEDRFRIYQATSDFIGHVISGTFDSENAQRIEHIIEFEIARDKAFFLFQGDLELLDYLEKLKQEAENYSSMRRQAKDQAQVGGPASKERDQKWDWFFEQHKSLKQKFIRHLSFKEFEDLKS